MTHPDLTPFEARVLAVAREVAGNGWTPTARRLYFRMRQRYCGVVSADVRAARLALVHRGLLPDPARTGVAG